MVASLGGGVGGRIGIYNICKDQRFFFLPFSLFKKVCYIIWEKKTNILVDSWDL